MIINNMVIIVNSYNKIFISKENNPYENKEETIAFNIGLSNKLIGLYSLRKDNSYNRFASEITGGDVYGDFVILKCNKDLTNISCFSSSKEIIDIILLIISKFHYLTLDNEGEERNIESISFGKYPQSLVTDINIIKELDLLKTVDDKGYVKLNDKEYARIRFNYDGIVKFHGVNYPIMKNRNYYFLVEEIKWLVLYDDEKKILISDKVLDYYPYNLRVHKVCLGNTMIDENEYYFSDIRKYLNEYFYELAFTKVEQRQIISPINDNNFQDRVTLLSNEIIDYIDDTNCQTSEFGAFIGCTELDEQYNVSWWLKSKGNSSSDVQVITNKGKQTSNYSCVKDKCGIRPLIYLKS